MKARNGSKMPRSLRKKNDLTKIKAALVLSIPSIFMGSVVAAQDTLETARVNSANDTNPYAEVDAPYKAKISGDLRHVKDLADTPQTINVLTQIQLQESGNEDLRDILAQQPGITLGTGENGNAFGDRYVIRGHEARSDVFVDGLRDPGMTTRESFAVEQIEITKGPSSTFAGRGSTGGAVNSITKLASTNYDFSKVQVGFGTDDYQRFNLDTNKRINDDLAIRANILFAERDVPDRSPASKERTGIALSASYQVNDKLNFIADYYYLDAEDKPDLGTYISRDSGAIVKDIPSYVQAEDFLNSKIETFTVRTDYKLSSNISIKNSMRYGTTENGYVVTGAGGTTRDATDPVAPNAATISFSTHQGWQDVRYFADQLNVYIDTEVADLKNQFVISAEYSDLSVSNGNYSNTNTGQTNCVISGRGGVQDGHCGLDANGNAVSGLNNLLGREITKGSEDSDYNVRTTSLSIMDTIDLTDQLSLFAGVRMDKFEYSNLVAGRGSDPASLYRYDDTLWNGHAGIVYQLNDSGNVYFTYSTSANINGGESDVGGNCGYGGICGDAATIADSEPEKVTNLELGTKWNLYNDKLLATAAIFQITKDDVMEGADYDSTGTLNTGKNRVEGIEVSLVGNITDTLSVQLGMSVMESEILDSFNNGINQSFDRRSNQMQATSDNRGKPLANFADKSAFLQLRYQATDDFSFGGTATYSSEVFTGQPDTAANEDLGVPGYTVFDLFANYQVNDSLKFRVNIGNVTDKAYYLTAYRSGTFTYIGDAREAKISVSYDF